MEDPNEATDSEVARNKGCYAVTYPADLLKSLAGRLNKKAKGFEGEWSSEQLEQELRALMEVYYAKIPLWDKALASAVRRLKYKTDRIDPTEIEAQSFQKIANFYVDTIQDATARICDPQCSNPEFYRGVIATLENVKEHLAIKTTINLKFTPSRQ